MDECENIVTSVRRNVLRERAPLAERGHAMAAVRVTAARVRACLICGRSFIGGKINPPNGPTIYAEAAILFGVMFSFVGRYRHSYTHAFSGVAFR